LRVTGAACGSIDAGGLFSEVDSVGVFSLRSILWAGALDGLLAGTCFGLVGTLLFTGSGFCAVFVGCCGVSLVLGAGGCFRGSGVGGCSLLVGGAGFAAAVLVCVGSLIKLADNIRVGGCSGTSISSNIIASMAAP
jgi:hypothetical protein